VQLGLVESQNLTLERRGKRLLVVDDDSGIRQMCARALDCFDVTQATDGRDALSLISQHPFDIILSDIMMPNLSGLELLRTIKETNPEQMVILMTGYSEKEVILQALKAGADDFISKPVNLLQLRTAIEKAVEKQALRREISSLKHLDQLKSEFLGLVSHKLKTPATAISLFIQNIAADNSDLNDPAFRQMLKMVQAETHHLEHLIQDLLYFSNVILHQDELRLESVDLGKTARQIVQHLAPVAEKKKLQLAVDITSPFPPQPLQLDRTRISFVLRALLDNAIKFTPAEGVIQLKGVLEKGTAKLSVRDNGPGIPSEELTKVFAKFYQVDPSSSGQIRGFGLGLFYARQFIQSMNGELSLESQPDFGTVASIELPLTT